MTHKNAGWPIAFAGLIALMLGASGAHAQVYRIVGPDGRVTYSDQPPPASQAKSVTTAGSGAGAAGNSQLPYELRQVAGRFPVTLYTGENCGPCGSARSHLTNRGIPFTEKTVSTNDDAQALNRLTGSSNLPLVTIGGQQLKGYSDAELTQFLDAAGYPKTSKLPAGYRNAPASPLVEVRQPSAQATDGAEDAPPRPQSRRRAAPAPIENNNPAGIRF